MDPNRYRGFNYSESDDSSEDRNTYSISQQPDGVYRMQGSPSPQKPPKRSPIQVRLGRFLVLTFVLSLLSSLGTGLLLNAHYREAFRRTEQGRKSSLSASFDETESQSEYSDFQNNSEGQRNSTPQATPLLSTSGKHYSVATAATKRRGNQEPLSIVDISKKGLPSVVAITTERSMDIGYFQTVTPVAGSGIILSEDGYIATNNHVVKNAKSIQVHLSSGDLYEAELVGADELSDLAVIRIKPRNNEKFPAAELGDSDQLEVGELAVAIGNPSGTLEGSVTAGIISALERSINVGGLEMNVLQTDAPINSGNSGGALLNSYGEVIGINSAKLSSDGSTVFDGIAFAIPINYAKSILENLREYGYVKDRVFLGISGREVSSDTARYYGLSDYAGILIERVVKGGSADEAGIRAGDFMVEFNGRNVRSVHEINNQKRELKVGDEVPVLIYRNGHKKSLTMVMQADDRDEQEKEGSQKEEWEPDGDESNEDNDPEEYVPYQND